jgi:adenosylcobinamide-GDP ribazoletransferase
MSVHVVAGERMSIAQALRRTGVDVATAVQFLTRIPLPSLPCEADSLARAVKFFPVVGLLIGTLAAAIFRLLSTHLARPVVAVLIVAFLVAITGCFHEDGLADVADAFGGGWNREQILAILKDSRIGSYGGTALVLSLLLRVSLLTALPAAHVGRYLIAAHVLCRWTTLPLSYFLAPARPADDSGQAARIARSTTRGTLIFGTLFTVAICGFLPHGRAAIALTGAGLLTLTSGRYYQRRIGGVAGDCFGATNQLTEIFVYLVGAWAL